MGMSASQARFLSLTARKNNVEFEGQQINQQRTTLSNESASYYSELCNLEVPTPPSIDDYTKVSYTFNDGAMTNTLMSLIPDTTPEGKAANRYFVNYVEEWQDDYAIVPTSSSLVEVNDPNSPTEWNIGNTYLRPIDSQGITSIVDGTVYLPLNNTAIYANSPAAGTGSETFWVTNSKQGVSQNTRKDEIEIDLSKYTIQNKAGGGYEAYIDSNAPVDVIERNGKYYYEKEVVHNIAKLDDFQKDYCIFTDTSVTPNRKYVKIPDENGNLTEYNIYESPVGAEYGGGSYIDLGEQKTYSRLLTGGEADTAQLAIASRGSSGSAATLDPNKYPYESSLSEEQLQALYKNEAYLLKMAQEKTGDNGSFYIRYVKNTTTGNYEPQLYAYSELKQSQKYNNKNLGAIPCFTLGSTRQTREVLHQEATIEKDASGRYVAITINVGDEKKPITRTYALTTTTTTDEEAYNDAMNQYRYKQHEYDHKIQEINSKLEIVQQQDKQLELKLKQLDTEENAISTEMDAVKKVISKNVESSFKTFNA